MRRYLEFRRIRVTEDVLRDVEVDLRCLPVLLGGSLFAILWFLVWVPLLVATQVDRDANDISPRFSSSDAIWIAPLCAGSVFAILALLFVFNEALTSARYAEYRVTRETIEKRGGSIAMRLKRSVVCKPWRNVVVEKRHDVIRMRSTDNALQREFPVSAFDGAPELLAHVFKASRR